MNASGNDSPGAVRAPGRPWAPMAAAVTLGAAMIWLAGAPLQAPSAGQPAPLRSATLREPPPGDRTSFPRRFAWEPVTGADLYEVTVVRDGAEVLFRQRGPSAVLDVSFDAAHEPPPGRYVWEVQAFRNGDALGAARGEFRVTR